MSQNASPPSPVPVPASSSSSTPAAPQPSAPTPAKETKKAKPTWWKPCAIILREYDGPIIGGEPLGLKSGIDMKLFCFNLPDTDPSIGFSMEFPLGPKIEDEGFGIRHSVDRGVHEGGVTAPTVSHKITVKFPRCGFDCQILPLTDCPRLLARFPGAKTNSSVVKVALREGFSEVEGFGLPFANPGHPSEAWLNHNGPIVGTTTLLDIVEQREFTFVVFYPTVQLGRDWAQGDLKSFSYPYGKDHYWSLDRYRDMLGQERGHQFAQAWCFHDDNAHLAALTQSVVQDVMWLDVATDKIAEVRFPVYFVNAKPESEDNKYYYVILPLSKDFIQEHDDVWRRLCKDGLLKLRLFHNGAQGDWDAKIVARPQSISVLDPHPVEKHEMVLFVRRPKEEQEDRLPGLEVNVFGDRASATLALRESRDR
ncbi:hypothetical protein BGZ63DRAFT_451852 [Mariannaea sp. PMI_226]|nr:hypothetical protein BGZ63DRAFT_451852 [Mariannaea sp. PMI_226]